MDEDYFDVSLILYSCITERKKNLVSQISMTKTFLRYISLF